MGGAFWARPMGLLREVAARGAQCLGTRGPRGQLALPGSPPWPLPGDPPLFTVGRSGAPGSLYSRTHHGLPQRGHPTDRVQCCLRAPWTHARAAPVLLVRRPRPKAQGKTPEEEVATAMAWLPSPKTDPGGSPVLKRRAEEKAHEGVVRDVGKSNRKEQRCHPNQQQHFRKGEVPGPRPHCGLLLWRSLRHHHPQVLPGPPQRSHGEEPHSLQPRRPLPHHLLHQPQPPADGARQHPGPLAAQAQLHSLQPGQPSLHRAYEFLPEPLSQQGAWWAWLKGVRRLRTLPL
nr:protein FAM166C isoform X6 [Pan troglodytes]